MRILRVSSTLDKSTPRKSLTDRDPGTCWTSTQGLPQWIHLTFATRILPTEVFFTFQGGFVATRVAVYTASELQSPSSTGKRDWDWILLKYVYPEDVNRKQQFDLTIPSSSHGVEGSDSPFKNGVDQVKFVFEQSSDFFGRVTLYDLDVFGTQKDIVST
jgi:hypothetical protein